MPPAENEGVDLRPIGGAVGAAIPSASLLEYLFRTLPRYKKMIQEAPDWTLANGDVDMATALKTLRPGDVGVAGLQRSAESNPLVDFLIQGSASSSGGPGAHGQIVGPNLRTPHQVARTGPKSKTPDLPLLFNSRGEAFGPQFAAEARGLRDVRSRQQAWAEYDAARASNKAAVKPDVKRPTKAELIDYKRFVAGYKDFAPGTTGEIADYGLLKENLRGRSKELQQLKARQQAWADYDTARAAGKDVPKPAGGRISARHLENLQKGKVNTAGKLRSLLRSEGIREFFGDAPQAQMADNMAQIRALQGGDEAAQAAQGRLQSLAKQFAGRGDARSKQLAEEISRIAREAPSRMRGGMPRSDIFKPKAFERFLPTLHHGGAMGSASDPLLAMATKLPESMRDAYREGIGTSVSTLRKNLQANARQMVADRRALKAAPDSFLYPTFQGGQTDTIYHDLVNEGSSVRPAKMPGNAYGGERGTTWFRPDSRGIDVNTDRLTSGLRGQVGKSYATTDAISAGAKEVFGVNAMRRWFPWMQKLPYVGGRGPGGATCWGNHCGSMPSATMQTVGLRRAPIPHTDTLPSTLLLDDGVKVLGVTNKAKVLKDLMRSAGKRSIMGLGAAGLIGAAGYGLGAVGNALKASPAKPMPPSLDPHMFAQAQKLLRPTS
jgi:hypothetical protein